MALKLFIIFVAITTVTQKIAEYYESPKNPKSITQIHLYEYDIINKKGYEDGNTLNDDGVCGNWTQTKSEIHMENYLTGFTQGRICCESILFSFSKCDDIAYLDDTKYDWIVELGWTSGMKIIGGLCGDWSDKQHSMSYQKWGGYIDGYYEGQDCCNNPNSETCKKIEL